MDHDPAVQWITTRAPLKVLGRHARTTLARRAQAAARAYHRASAPLERADLAELNDRRSRTRRCPLPLRCAITPLRAALTTVRRARARTRKTLEQLSGTLLEEPARPFVAEVAVCGNPQAPNAGSVAGLLGVQHAQSARRERRRTVRKLVRPSSLGCVEAVGGSDPINLQLTQANGLVAKQIGISRGTSEVRSTYATLQNAIDEKAIKLKHIWTAQLKGDTHLVLISPIDLGPYWREDLRHYPPDARGFAGLWLCTPGEFPLRLR